MGKVAKKPVAGRSAPTRAHLTAALGNAALEGLHPAPADLADLEKLVEGGLDGAGYLRRVKARHEVPRGE